MNQLSYTLIIAAICLAVLDGTITFASEWDQFRGPNGSGLLVSSQPPTDLSPSSRAWKTSIPTGHSSPILAGNQIILTGENGTNLETIALDKRSGEILWRKNAPTEPKESVHEANGRASSTPCTDGKLIYSYFGSYGLLCYDLDGNQIWEKPIPTPKSMYGMSTSPILHGESVILVLDDDQNLPDSKLSRSKVMALDKASGKLLWETPRPYNRSGWSTPMIWTHQEGSDLVVLGNGRVYGYAPETGDERWYVNGFALETIAIPVAGNNRLYASASMRGGRGDLQLDPEPFWQAILTFDQNKDQQISKSEISTYFTIPLRPELPVEHPGFGIPLPKAPKARKERQEQFFDWRDQNKDGLWTRDEYFADMQIGSGRPLMAAISPGGHGDVTASKVDWELRRGIPEIPSPVYFDQRIYLLRAGGLLSCVDASNGKTIYRERLQAPGQYAASPVIANGHLYCASQEGVISVAPIGDTFRITSQADLKTGITATPALDQNTLYIRTENALLAYR